MTVDIAAEFSVEKRADIVREQQRDACGCKSKPEALRC